MHSFKNGLPQVKESDVCVVLAPCVQSDYENAKSLAKICKAVVLVNGFAKVSQSFCIQLFIIHSFLSTPSNDSDAYSFTRKDTKSVPETATMAYFFKPLTYNSQIVGYLQRRYPNDWVTLDATTKKSLKSFSDSQILVPKTNTPDLREPGRLVQRVVDQRAIEARRNQ